MTHLDLFYRAFNDYKKHTKTSLECVRFNRKVQALKSVENESLTAVFASCTIDEDWIEAIETGLPFILKAIKEERQFIRNDGEVLPIEKVRKTSKYSIQDLAKHSNYISHEAPEHLNTDIMPDKVLVIRKENDYTVYENRVLYATLLYLQDFVSSRLSKIKEFTNKYEANAKINKKVIIGNRTLDFEMKLNEIIKDDPIAMKRNKYQGLIERLDAIYANILSLLRTPLMIECGKVDTVTRPITKTNVLRMNRNFKESLRVFDYIAEYDKPGYTVTVTEKNFNPLAMNITFDYGEMINLSSFITYMHVNGLTEELKASFDEEEKRLKQEEEDRLLAKARRIEGAAKVQGKTLQEYLIVLTEANRILTARNEELNLQIENLKKQHQEEIDHINEEHETVVNHLNEQHQLEVNNLNEVHEKAINDLNESHQEEVSQINLAHENEVNELNDKHVNEVNELNRVHEEKVTTLTNDYENTIADLRNDIQSKQEEIESTKKACEDEVARINEETNQFKEELIAKSNQEIEEMRNLKEKAEAELLAIRLQHGLKLDPNDFTTEERFNELEKEKKHLDELFNKAWKETKKQIRKNLLSEKPKKMFFLSKKSKLQKEVEKETLKEQTEEIIETEEAPVNVEEAPINMEETQVENVESNIPEEKEETNE